MSEPGAIRSIGQIHISVDDLPGAVAFYRDALGLPLLFEVPEQSMAFFDCGGVRLYLGKPEGAELRSNPLIYYAVDSIQAAYRAMEARGATFDSEPHVVHRTETSELWIAGLRDPEGNYLCLMSEVPK